MKPPRRGRWTIVAVPIAVLFLATGGGIIARSAAGAAGRVQQPAPTATLVPTLAVSGTPVPGTSETPQPTATPVLAPSATVQTTATPGLPTATSLPFPTPGPSLTATPLPHGAPFENSAFFVEVPDSFTKQQSDDISAAWSNNDGVFKLESSRLSAPTTAFSLLEQLINSEAQTYPGAAICGDGGEAKLGNITGIFYPVCFNVTRTDGSAFVAEDLVWVATNVTSTVYYEAQATSAQDNASQFATEAGLFLQTLRWKLF